MRPFKYTVINFRVGDYFLPGWVAVQCGSLPTFWRNMLPPSSGFKDMTSKQSTPTLQQTEVCKFYQMIWRQNHRRQNLKSHNPKLIWMIMKFVDHLRNSSTFKNIECHRYTACLQNCDTLLANGIPHIRGITILNFFHINLVLYDIFVLLSMFQYFR
jgi:hypothetical protein